MVAKGFVSAIEKEKAKRKFQGTILMSLYVEEWSNL